jgi:hypothetical protein
MVPSFEAIVVPPFRPIVSQEDRREAVLFPKGVLALPKGGTGSFAAGREKINSD